MIFVSPIQYSWSLNNKIFTNILEHFNYRETDTDELPHHKEQLWLFENMNRNDADKALWGKERGTFLIRPSAGGDWACSIV